MVGGQQIDKGVWSTVRKTLPALKASAYRDFKEILGQQDFKLQNLVKENRSELTFTFNGRTVEFFSVDNQQKVRSRKRQILFCPEANELDFKTDFQQLLFRTTDKIFIDFNPDDPDIWINTELEEKRAILKGDVEVIVSTYKDNSFLDSETIAEIEYTEQTDPELWEVYGKGQYGKITGLIYKKVELIESFPDYLDTVIYGLDFGYNDPQALIKVGVNDLDLYLEQLSYKRFQLVSDLINELPGYGIEKRDLIYCDSARPGSRQEIENAGYVGALPSKKGKGSVADGIGKLKKYRWHIVASSEKLISERKKYKWATDKNGEPIEGTPIDMYNHALDAIRYAVYTHFYDPDFSDMIRKST